jgi:predicted transcriptional regulator
MLDKGTAQRVSVYSAAVEKVDTLAAFARDFSQRVMEMDAPLTAAMFTGSKLVDQQELAQLDELLQNWPCGRAMSVPGPTTGSTTRSR